MLQGSKLCYKIYTSAHKCYDGVVTLLTSENFDLLLTEALHRSPTKNMGTVHAKCKVQKVHITGLGRTKNDLVIPQVQDVLKSENFKDVIQRSAEAKLRLEALGIFSSVGVLVDTAKGPGAKPNGMDITFKVKETRRLLGSAHTTVGNNEGTLALGAKMPNLCGRAENLVAEYSRSSRKSNGFSVTFLKPYGKDLNRKFTVSAFKSDGDFPQSSFKETDIGTFVEFVVPNGFNRHNFRWEGVWRETSCLGRTASFDVRSEAGHSLKSSLKHTFTRDTRDEHIFPSKGYLVRIAHELAGETGGDVKFLKEEFEVQLNKKLLFDSVLSCTLQGGLMKPYRDSKSLIIDRFFLGGPTSVRGFQMRSIGPHSNGDYVGAEAFMAAGLHLYTPLPFRPGRGSFGDLFRTHLFVNGGHLANVNLETPNWREDLQQLRQTVRCSYGAGILLRLGRIARFELNYCVPVSAQAEDKIQGGVQFGVGINFL
ncbi:sorting and assembly machinery component 50 homolog B-like isoform X2 [Anneissia japonica]|uniref:sorting and assembly machinery component 50 homolog B-like isoform X2 n=1 Tax=Anneissia japonica TaxID=1529436 RepID=UPI0014257FF0|nr:sorting and assembly machinery component 50 homolog B-like isoform X2 [Anneissia japonica]